MKKTLLLGVLLLLFALLLSGCAGDPEPEVTPSPDPTATPTPYVPTPEPTITPRPMGGDIERPGPDETPLSIDPVDKPTPEPIIFEPYQLFVSEYLDIQFEVPEYWGAPADHNANSNTIVFSEPPDDIRSGEALAASLTVQVNRMSTAQTERDAENMLDQFLDSFRTQFPSLSTSDKANNSLGGVSGKYVTYWIDVPLSDDSEETLRMRGRCLVVPIDRTLYLVRYLCPADRNTDYEKVYRQVRETFAEVERAQ